MTINGIMRVSDIQREIDGIVKEIAVEGSGSYTGVNTSNASTTPPPSRRGNKSTTVPRLLTNIPPTRTGSRDSNVNNFRDTGFDFFNRIPPPMDGSPGSVGRGQVDRESVYPDLEYYLTDRRDRDYSEERLSKYGERRFGVVTPKGNTPDGLGWRESGRPF
jgi:hypothetical protein